MNVFAQSLWQHVDVFYRARPVVWNSCRGPIHLARIPCRPTRATVSYPDDAAVACRSARCDQLVQLDAGNRLLSSRNEAASSRQIHGAPWPQIRLLSFGTHLAWSFATSRHAGTFPVSLRHFNRHDCASRTLLKRTVSIGQGKALPAVWGASKYSRSRIALIEPVFSCTDPTEAMFIMPAFTIALDSSIGMGFASATVLKAMSNAASIKGFIGLASFGDD